MGRGQTLGTFALAAVSANETNSLVRASYVERTLQNNIFLAIESGTGSIDSFCFGRASQKSKYYYDPPGSLLAPQTPLDV